MKKVICILMAVCLCSVFLCIPCFALVSGAGHSGTVVFAPSYITATRTNDLLYTTLDCATVIANVETQSNDVELTSYGSTSDRICYSNVLTQYNYKLYSGDYFYGVNRVLGRVQTLFSSVDYSGDYFNSSYDFFPLQTDDGTTRYSAPFTDSCRLDYVYNDVYVDVTNSVNTALAPTFRVYFAYNGAHDDYYVKQYFESYYRIRLDISTHTGDGLVVRTFDIPLNVSVDSSSDWLSYADMHVDIYKFLCDFANSNTGVVVANDVAMFPSVRLTLENTSFEPFLVNTHPVEFVGYIFGYNSYVVDSTTYIPLVDSYIFDNNVNLNGGDFIDWIFNTATSVLGTEFIPGIALGGLLSIVVGLSLGIWVLKVFAGG